MANPGCHNPATAQLPGKRKRVVLTIRQKLEIIRHLEAGRMPKELAVQFGIGEQTVRDLRRSKEQLEHFAEASGDASDRLKSMKLSHYQVLERALWNWLQGQGKLGVAVTSAQCADQAKHLFETLKMEGKFNTHGSWMHRFKLRHGIGTVPPPARMLATGHLPENASMHVEATYGENHGEFIVPMSDAAERQLMVRPSTAPRDVTHSMVLSDVRSLVVAAKSPPEIQVKEEAPDGDGADKEDADDDDVVEDVVVPGPPTVSASPAPPVLHVVPQAVTTPTPSPTATNGPSFAKNRKRPAPYASCSSSQERKSRLEIEVLLATKRKLEAEERRANAEAEFYQEEKRRSMALVSLHEGERRKLSVIAELHAEERRKASSKADLLQEHRNYYLEQQKTEVVRRRLLLLEIQKVKKELNMQR